MQYTQNSIAAKDTLVMYIDMNSYFASCEQQLRKELRGHPIGVIPHQSATACVIAPSVEAKQFGVKTGMRLDECRVLCPHIKPVVARPFHYRRMHIRIMDILKKYCDDVLAKSIDEAVVNLTSYRLVYKDVVALGRQIKADIAADPEIDYLKCSIGIAPNSFLAKVGTELQKPDGLVQITPDNIDEQLARLPLRGLPGIASRNERRLIMIGIRTPVEMRHASPALLRKAFGGVVGNYWHARLNFGEVDLYSNNFRTMSATRTISRQQASSRQSLDSMLISLCTKLEQRMVKQNVFCGEASFFIRYHNFTAWDTQVRFVQPVQDAMELRQYILQKANQVEADRGIETIFTSQVAQMGVGIQKFSSDMCVQYSLFDNRIRQDVLRKAMYNIKDTYGKNIIRKASELFEPKVMRDAIGFGSIKDMYANNFNQYAIEEEEE
jgi:DNA polymerase-4